MAQGPGAAMIYVGLGANLPHADFGPPEATLEAALGRFPAHGLRVGARSPWYRSAPVPRSDQPWFVNGVVALETGLGPAPLLGALHGIEAEFGRLRRERWGPRIIDLDLLAFHDSVLSGLAPGEPHVPHPRLHERAFVLLPLADIASAWRHPALQRGIQDLIADLAPGQAIERMAGAAPALAGDRR